MQTKGAIVIKTIAPIKYLALFYINFGVYTEFGIHPSSSEKTVHFLKGYSVFMMYSSSSFDINYPESFSYLVITLLFDTICYFPLFIENLTYFFIDLDEELNRFSGVQFDPYLVSLFIEGLESSGFFFKP
jgi:hypothetical protein